MPDRILLTGATGLFGSNFVSRLKKNSRYRITAISRNKIFKNSADHRFLKADITDKKEMIRISEKVSPKIIIHTASLGNVDYCQMHQKEAWLVNVEGTRNIIAAAQKVKAWLIFFSTNAIYDGRKPPYGEDSVRKPVDFYGRTKAVSEDDIRRSKISWVIIRLMTMYGWHQNSQRPNPVTWLISQLEKSRSVKVVNDVYNNHLYVGQAIDAVLKVVGLNKKNDTFNIAGSGCISRFDLALKVADKFHFDRKYIFPVSSNFFSRLAPRPPNTCFSTAKMERELKIKPISADEGLDLMKKEMDPG
ncbi:hypothetical protein A3D78_00260 [Candidatus Gottesmanbacteria bacterium RIFCSPHIGHO2_02_FULL_39_14]|uniref:dTDP-4-dehydrorhamnose reductase n=1 Tax=Candidatus Gottesmanbacteria bacterium RIFCSPHIGHO2_02_FULL_39_14 TaxID=1798383 RepID=A0A1F5ZVV9_9BACT|nr:MAG: hypothetical protein A3D78_00260 [Candidatus Gottesmanbacteria bacterium RIFCSPHIGHO2_02_FULL_39_14]